MKKEFEYYNLLHKHTGHTHAHKHTAKSDNLNTKIPVTVIGGFLGSGKTSLINHLLSASSEKPIDVLVREYGEIPIDDMLIHIDPKRLHVFSGISLHFDPQIMLYGFMDDLHEESGDNMCHLLIETSGMDESEYLLRLFLLANIRDKYRLSSFVTIIDAEYAHINLDEYAFVQEQVAYADVVLLNKTDLVKNGEVIDIVNRVRGINGLAAIYNTEYCSIDPDKILEVDAFDQVMNIEPLKSEENEVSPMDQIKTVALTETKPMDKEKINRWLDIIFRDKSMKLLRSKGFFYFAGSDYKFEFQGVRTSFHSKADRQWEEGEQRKSTVVFIGEGLDESRLKQEFSECVQDEI